MIKKSFWQGNVKGAKILQRKSCLHLPKTKITGNEKPWSLVISSINDHFTKLPEFENSFIDPEIKKACLFYLW